MKRLHTCVLALALLGVFIFSATETTQAQDNKKVVIIKKQVDENGEQTVERIVLQGEDADAAFAEENGEVTEDVFIVKRNTNRSRITSRHNAENLNVSVNVNENDGRKVIEIDVDGEVEVITLEPGEELSKETRARLAEKGVFLSGGDAPDCNTMVWQGDFDDADATFRVGSISKGMVTMGKGLAHIGDINWGNNVWATQTEDINCVALGVYASTASVGGTYVSNIIGASGAEEAGIQRGDIITSIDEYPTTRYRELHEALAMYEPGDVVTVTFKRGEGEQRVEAQLRAWKDLPSFANRPHAKVTCDKEATEEVVTRKIIVIKKDRNEEAETDEPTNVNQSPIDIEKYLDLTDFTAFPNPTDGKFSIQFSAEAVPTTVTVYNASGIEIFRDNVENFSGNYTREIDVTNQVRGALVLSIEQGGKLFTEQIILN